MTENLAPNQQLLLWDLGLRGGKALQKDVDYKGISKDRARLEKLRLLSVIKIKRTYTLELTDNGWNELSKRTSVLLKSKKKPSRERLILQLLLDALQSYATRQSMGLGEILKSSSVVPPSDNLRQQIRQAFFEIAGMPPQDSVRLSALRAKLSDIPRRQLDDALLEMSRAHKINLMNFDNPRDVKAEESSALRDGNRTFHVLWIDR